MFIQQVAVQMIFLAIMGRTAKWLVRINWKNVDQLRTSIYSYVNTEFVTVHVVWDLHYTNPQFKQ